MAATPFGATAGSHAKSGHSSVPGDTRGRFLTLFFQRPVCVKRIEA